MSSTRATLCAGGMTASVTPSLCARATCRISRLMPLESRNVRRVDRPPLAGRAPRPRTGRRLAPARSRDRAPRAHPPGPTHRRPRSSPATKAPENPPAIRPVGSSPESPGFDSPAPAAVDNRQGARKQRSDAGRRAARRKAATRRQHGPPPGRRHRPSGPPRDRGDEEELESVLRATAGEGGPGRSPVITGAPRHVTPVSLASRAGRPHLTASVGAPLPTPTRAQRTSSAREARTRPLASDRAARPRGGNASICRCRSSPVSRPGYRRRGSPR
jgi:hypothetical protein